MKTLKFIFLFILLVSPSIPLAPNSSVKKFIQFEWVTRSPGNAIAFRTSQNNFQICTQGQCYKATEKWQLVPTSMNHGGNVGILIQNNSNWVTRGFKTEKPLFERSQNHFIQLRIPSSVIQNILDSEEEIAQERIKDRELFKTVTDRPFGSRWRKPIETSVTSLFGSARIPPKGSPYAHTGIDLHAPMGSPVRACSDGIVTDEGKDPVYGNVLTIDHGGGLFSRYMHLSKFSVGIGEIVKAGDLIALSGSTGRSEAPHLHWEMRLRGLPIDPLATTLLLERLAYLE